MDNHKAGTSRRRLLGAAAGSVAFAPRRLWGQAVPPQSAGGVERPPFTLNVMDAVGNIRLTAGAFAAYRQARPELVARIIFHEAPALKVPGRLKLQEEAGRPGIDLVLTGLATLWAGAEQGLWHPLVPEEAERLPNLREILLRPAWEMQGLARGQGLVVSYSPTGPLLVCRPDRVTLAPRTARELLAWARAHPDRFAYGRPARSPASRTFLMELPYLLEDTDPRDPVRGWDKTWSYLAELGTSIKHYPAGSSVAITEWQAGWRDMIVTTIGEAVALQVGHAVPAAVAAPEPLRWISDAHYAALPKGLSPAKLAVLLDLLSFLLTPQAQDYAYDQVSFYPGPAIAGANPGLSSRMTQAGEVGPRERAEYDRLIAAHPAVTPLHPDKLAYAVRRWEEQIGG